MNWYEWILFIVGWSLVPLVMYFKYRQTKKFRQWQKEDSEMVEKFLNDYF